MNLLLFGMFELSLKVQFEEDEGDDKNYLDNMTSPGDNFLKNVRKEKLKQQHDKKE